MSARYRVRQARQAFTPQRKFLWFWVRMVKPQKTIEAANEIIRQHRRTRHGHGPRPGGT
jgi:hypothetical protein